YWNLTAANSLASNNFNATLVATGFSSYATSSITKVIKRANGGSNWTLNGTHTAFSGSTATRSAMTSGATTQLGIGFTALAPSASITGSSNISCNGLSDGSVNLTVSNGTPP